MTDLTIKEISDAITVGTTVITLVRSLVRKRKVPTGSARRKYFEQIMMRLQTLQGDLHRILDVAASRLEEGDVDGARRILNELGARGRARRIRARGELRAATYLRGDGLSKKENAFLDAIDRYRGLGSSAIKIFSLAFGATVEGTAEDMARTIRRVVDGSAEEFKRISQAYALLEASYVP
jgi:hypothetical protein